MGDGNLPEYVIVWDRKREKVVSIQIPEENGRITCHRQVGNPGLFDIRAYPKGGSGLVDSLGTRKGNRLPEIANAVFGVSTPGEAEQILGGIYLISRDRYKIVQKN